MSSKQTETTPSGSAPSAEHGSGRRDFLKTVGAFPVALAAAGNLAGTGRATAASLPSLEVDQQTLPQIKLGPYSISRVVCGANCFNAGSHLSIFVNRAMKEYYTEEQIFRTLRRCQEVGINCWQDGVGNVEMYRRFVDQGLQMRYIALAAGDSSNIDKLKQNGCVAIAHHGELTDRLFKQGELDKAEDFLKRVRDAGLVVGVSTHMPDVVDAIESKGWDLDYYMTCVYERHRSKEDLEKLLGQAPIPVGEVYLPNDPPRMFRAIQQTARPCLAFKILAAGRLSDRQQWVENAFQQTFASIKSSDGVIVGMYDRYSDQPAENADYARRFGRHRPA
ncbi:MAG: hypothetical protein JJ992_25200 [Planctomycetes bacterium]|nr:hypothetical protein [Planctomycetota bacterium]